MWFILCSCLCSLLIIDTSLLEETIEKMNKTIKMQQDKLDKQGLLLQGFFKKAEELQHVKSNNRPVDKANEPSSSYVQNHFLDNFLDYSYSPPPFSPPSFSPPLSDSNLLTMSLPQQQQLYHSFVNTQHNCSVTAFSTASHCFVCSITR